MLAALLVLMLPGAARAQDDLPFIDGSPLNVYSDGLGALQVKFDSREGGEFYSPSSFPAAHAGLEIREGDAVSYVRAEDRTVEQPLTRDGSTLTSRYRVPLPVPLSVAEEITYGAGTRDVRIRYVIENVGEQAASFDAGELADLYLAGSDLGRGVLLGGEARLVGGVDRGGSISGLLEVTRWDAYQEGDYGDVFDAFDNGSGLRNSVDPGEQDNGVGAQWRFADVAPGTTRTVEVVWRFDAGVHVTTTTDHVDDGACDDKDCTLREALAHAPDGSIVSVPGGEAHYALDSRLGELRMARDVDLTVLGGGAEDANGTVIDGGSTSRVLEVLDGAKLTLSGLRLTGGNGQPGGGDRGAGELPPGLGGALAVDAGATVTVVDTEVAGNAASGAGGGIATAGVLHVVRSTLAGNRALPSEGPGHGGGLFTTGAGATTLVNSTVSDNQAPGGAGGGIAANGPLKLVSVTVAGNGAAHGGGISQEGADQGNNASIVGRNTVVALNEGGNCSASGVSTRDVAHSLSDDASCALGVGNIEGKDAQLGPLQYNGGSTRTRAPSEDSPLIDAGDNAACGDPLVAGIDQIGRERIRGVACDIGAVEGRPGPPRPPVIGSPANGAFIRTHDVPVSGTAQPNSVVYVVPDGEDEGPTTQADADGRWSLVLTDLDDGPYTMVAYAETEGGVSDASQPIRFAVDTTPPAAPAIVGSGASSSTVTLSGTAEPGTGITILEADAPVGQTTSGSDGAWTVQLAGVSPGEHHYTAVSTDRAGNRSSTSVVRTVAVPVPQQATPTPTPPPSTTPTPVPPPVAGKSVNVETKSGKVLIKLPGSNRFIELGPGQQVPVGTTIDTTKGRITLTAASDRTGGTQAADFYEGVFTVAQTRSAKPITELRLAGPKPSCGTARKSAHAAAKKKAKKRRLWGDGSGAFRTRGQYSSATVRGTTWLTEDRCGATLTRVKRGVVAVRDFARRKTVVVRAGRSYLARARRR